MILKYILLPAHRNLTEFSTYCNSIENYLFKRRQLFSGNVTKEQSYIILKIYTVNGIVANQNRAIQLIEWKVKDELWGNNTSRVLWK